MIRKLIHKRYTGPGPVIRADRINSVLLGRSDMSGRGRDTETDTEHVCVASAQDLICFYCGEPLK